MDAAVASFIRIAGVLTFLTAAAIFYHRHRRQTTMQAGRSSQRTEQSAVRADILDDIERLHDLKRRGVLSESEFNDRKWALMEKVR